MAGVPCVRFVPLGVPKAGFGIVGCQPGARPFQDHEALFGGQDRLDRHMFLRNARGRVALKLDDAPEVVDESPVVVLGPMIRVSRLDEERINVILADDASLHEQGQD